VAIQNLVEELKPVMLPYTMGPLAVVIRVVAFHKCMHIILELLCIVLAGGQTTGTKKPVVGTGNFEGTGQVEDGTH
jgi:hypothetical protein